MLGCEVDGNTGVGSGCGVIAVSAYMGVHVVLVFCLVQVLEMSVVRGVGGVCDMCKCLSRGGAGFVVGDRIGFGLYQFLRNMGYVYVLVEVVWVVLGESGSAARARIWEVGVVLCMCML